MKKLIRTSDGITIEIPQNESPNGAYAKQLVDAERAKRKQSYVTKSNENFQKEQDQRAIRFDERELDGEMAQEALTNAPESAINVVKGIYDVGKNAITSPLESLQAVGETVEGGLANASDTYRDYLIGKGKKDAQRAQKAIDKFTSRADMSTTRNQKLLKDLENARDNALGNYDRIDKKADAVGKYYKDRLGGWKEIKQTMAEDPVGALLDFSGITGIARSLGKNIIKQPYNAVTKLTNSKNPKLESFGNKVDDVTSTITDATNPLTWIGSGANAGANMALSSLDLVTSRVGRQAVKGALGAGADSVKGLVPYFGKNARKRAEGFRDAKSGKLSETAIAQLAKDKLTQAQINKNARYDSEFSQIKDTPLTSAFEGIREAINKARLKYTTKNGVVADRVLDRMIDKMEKEINYFQANKGLHTIEGIDALKQSLNTLVEKIPFNNKRQRMVGAEITRSVQQSLVNSNPKYAQIMKQYGDDSTFINEGVGKTLGTTSRANLETVINKLKNAMKETQQTKGRAVQSLDEFGEAGQLLPQIVGSIFNNWTPRGGLNMTGLIGGAGVGAGIATGTLGMILPFLALQSPRVMGNILYRLGQAGGVPIQLLQWMYRQDNFRNIAVSYANADNSIELEDIRAGKRNEPNKFEVEFFNDHQYIK
jgi:hypothetical protein